MLGELVEYGFEVKSGDPVQVGQVIGWIEGFKALSDLYCVVEGHFQGGNPDLENNIALIHTDPYGEGWLYLVKGTPEANSVDVRGYVEILDRTIDKIQGQHQVTLTKQCTEFSLAPR
jgi:glycine cleavage system H protein